MGMSRRQEALCACLKDKSRVGAATKCWASAQSQLEMVGLSGTSYKAETTTQVSLA